MRAFVPLPSGLSATDWARRHSLDEVPDASPYGLHKLADYGVEVSFGEPDLGPRIARLAQAGRNRLGGLEFFECFAQASARASANTDVVIAPDERTSVPASLLRTKKGAPVVTGIGWLVSRDFSRTQTMFADRALPRAAAIWVHGERLRSVIADEWRLPQSLVHYIPFGIDTDFYAVQPQPHSPDPVVVSAGEDRDRDHQLLIDAVAKLKPKHPTVSLELATGMPVDMPAGLGRLHRERLYGRMRDLYRRAAVVAIAVKPTVRGSGMTVALEAMASGRPVVMTANPDIATYVEHGVTGLLVPPNDMDAFAAAIGELLSEPERAIEMGNAAAVWVRERFTTDLMAQQLADLAKRA